MLLLVIFSSSAAVYGDLLSPEMHAIPETHALNPINPYGKSKKMVEEILADLANRTNLAYVILRYFNAAGAHPDGILGEQHLPESHLIPLVLQAALQAESVLIYGDDYPTADGTCIRDYIHVMDLCQAHLQALEGLFAGNKNKIYNLGCGIGHSVLDVVNCVADVTNRPIDVQKQPRRTGDAAVLLADIGLATQELGWKPHFSELKTIIQHAWNYYCKRILPHTPDNS